MSVYLWGQCLGIHRTVEMSQQNISTRLTARNRSSESMMEQKPMAARRCCCIWFGRQLSSLATLGCPVKVSEISNLDEGLGERKLIASTKPFDGNFSIVSQRHIIQNQRRSRRYEPRNPKNLFSRSPTDPRLRPETTSAAVGTRHMTSLHVTQYSCNTNNIILRSM